MLRSSRFPGADQMLATSPAMASGKKNALLSSLADYGDDSEPDSEPDIEETGTTNYYLLKTGENTGYCSAKFGLIKVASIIANM